MDDVKLLLTEVGDNQLNINGVISDAAWVKEAAGRLPRYIAVRLDIPMEKVAEQLEPALRYGISTGTLEGNTVMFKFPVAIKSAAPIVMDDHGLSAVLTKLTDGTLVKEAQNSFCDELVDAIAAAKVDVSSTGMELSMPLKLEFRDEATKNAFLNIGRKKKMQKIASDKSTVLKIASRVITMLKLAESKVAVKGKK